MLARTSPDGEAATLPVGTVSHLAWEASNKYHLPPGSADRLVCLAWYESSFRPEVISTAGYFGLLQFSPRTYSYYSQLAGQTGAVGGSLDPAVAMDVAAFLVATTGSWRHWGPVIDGRC